jgi:hypothetical protein
MEPFRLEHSNDARAVCQGQRTKGIDNTTIVENSPWNGTPDDEESTSPESPRRKAFFASRLWALVFGFVVAVLSPGLGHSCFGPGCGAFGHSVVWLLQCDQRDFWTSLAWWLAVVHWFILILVYIRLVKMYRKKICGWMVAYRLCLKESCGESVAGDAAGYMGASGWTAGL